MTLPQPNGPGLVSGASVTPRHVLMTQEGAQFLPHNKTIKGSKSRDWTNTDNLDVLRPGTLMGKVTADSTYAPSILGVMAGAMTSVATTVSVSAASAVEMVRRNGSAVGTFKFTGPPTANGTVRTLSASVSAIDQSTGALTFTALGVNEVQTVTFAIASTGGSIALQLWDPRTSQYVQVPAAAWNATDATYLAAIQAKLDLAFGAANIVVVSAQAATDTDSALVFTWSGTGVAALPCTDAAGVAKLPIVTTLPTSSTSYGTARTTSGVDGRFAAGSFVQPNDGSETPVTFVPDGTGIKVTDRNGTSADTSNWGRFPIGGTIKSAQLLPVWPSDTSLRAWIVSQLRAVCPGFVFDHLL